MVSWIFVLLLTFFSARLLALVSAEIPYGMAQMASVYEMVVFFRVVLLPKSTCLAVYFAEARETKN
jgi:hypothetical protein